MALRSVPWTVSPVRKFTGLGLGDNKISMIIRQSPLYSVQGIELLWLCTMYGVHMYLYSTLTIALKQTMLFR